MRWRRHGHGHRHFLGCLQPKFPLTFLRFLPSFLHFSRENSDGIPWRHSLFSCNLHRPSHPSLSVLFCNSFSFPYFIDRLILSCFSFSWEQPVLQIAYTVVDYKYSLHGLPVDSHEYLQKLSEVFLLSLSLSVIFLFPRVHKLDYWVGTFLFF